MKHFSIKRLHFLLSFGAMLNCAAATEPAPAPAPASRLGDEELLLLGSGASEGMPNFYCVCDFCKQAREAGGKNLRLRTAYALGENIRIDWGPDALAQSRKFQLEPWKLEYIFITHSHEDHLFPMDFWVRGVSELPEQSDLKLYGNQQVIQAVGAMIGNQWEKNQITPEVTIPGNRIDIPEKNLTVTALAANHTAPEQSLMYLFEHPDYTMLITGDTDVFPEATLAALSGKAIDVLLIDATWMMSDRNESHLGIPNLVRLLKTLRQRNALAENALVIPVHLAPGDGALLHEEFAAAIAPLGMTASFDGMKIDLKTRQTTEAETSQHPADSTPSK